MFLHTSTNMLYRWIMKLCLESKFVSLHCSPLLCSMKRHPADQRNFPDVWPEMKDPSVGSRPTVSFLLVTFRSFSSELIWSVSSSLTFSYLFHTRKQLPVFIKDARLVVFPTTLLSHKVKFGVGGKLGGYRTWSVWGMWGTIHVGTT